MSKINYKKIQFYLALITLFVLFASFYSQYFLGLNPCPLCIMQRICVFLLLICMGLSLGTLKKAHLISLLQTLVSCAGLFFASRQLWLQSLPSEQAPSCMPGLDILIRYFPWQTVAHALFWGSGDCAEITWSLLGITMPGWAAIYFFLMGAVSLYLYIRTRSLNS